MSPDEDRTTCSACRGTGSVISNLGGTPHQVTCPWCRGDGVFHSGQDAQAPGPTDAGETEPAADDSDPDADQPEPPDVVA